MPLTSRISQSISAAASGSSARASGIGHWATISWIAAVPHRMPQFLGDERHERVEHDQDLVEHPAGDGAGLVGASPPSPNSGLISSRYQSQKRAQANW